MFRPALTRLRAWLEAADDLLGDSPQAAPAPTVPLHLTHPHRQPLRWQRTRRPGSVAAKPAYCLSPVRASRGLATERDRVGP